MIFQLYVFPHLGNIGNKIMAFKDSLEVYTNHYHLGGICVLLDNIKYLL